MIRAELGDDLFWKSVAIFVNDNAHKTVETIDLLRAIEKASGRNLLFLFDQYVYRGGHPDYKVAYAWDNDSNLAKVTVTQTQAKDGSQSELFDLKVPIGFGWIGEERGERREGSENDSHLTPHTSHLTTFPVRIHEKEQAFYFPLEKKPDFVSFDVGNHILKTVVLEYPVPELKVQLKADPDPLSRIIAAEMLAKKGGLEAVNALIEALANEPFWGVRVEIAKNLAGIKLDQAVEGVIAGLKDTDARVRRSTVEALANIKTRESYKALKPIAEQGDASYYVEAAAIRALGSILTSSLGESKEEKVLKLLKSVLKERQGWNEVVRSGAIGALSQMKTSEEALSLILEYTAPGVPQALRLAAIRAIGAISTGQTNSSVERILDRLQELSRETFFLTQVSVVIALGQMETARAIGILQSLADQTPDGRVRRIAEEAVQRVQKNVGSDKAVKQLREELDQLKQANQELRSRLENLEAKAK